MYIEQLYIHSGWMCVRMYLLEGILWLEVSLMIGRRSDKGGINLHRFIGCDGREEGLVQLVS